MKSRLAFLMVPSTGTASPCKPMAIVPSTKHGTNVAECMAKFGASFGFAGLCSISTRKQAGQPFMGEQKGVPTFNSFVGLRIPQGNLCPVKWWPIVWSGHFFPCSAHSPGSILLTFFSFELMACSSRLVTFFYVHFCQCCWDLVACGQVDAPIPPFF